MLVQRAKLGDLPVSQHATWGMSAEMLTDAGYTGLDPVKTALRIEALCDGLWMNLLLHSSDSRLTVCRTRAINVIAVLFPKHFQMAPDDKKGPTE
jgi:hypothetical protein